MRKTDFYRTFEHTADLGIETWGKDLKSMFINAAKAIFTEIAGSPPTKASKGPFEVRVTASNLEDLLVRWLEELLFLSETKRVVFFKFKISKLEKTQLEAMVWGADFCEVPPEREIKAVTYHDLKIEKTKDGYTVRFVADI